MIEAGLLLWQPPEDTENTCDVDDLAYECNPTLQVVPAPHCSISEWRQSRQDRKGLPWLKFLLFRRIRGILKAPHRIKFCRYYRLKERAGDIS